MERADQRLVIVDAGPLIHLDELDCIPLLDGFTSVCIPSTVWEEVVLHRPKLVPGKIPAAKILDPEGREVARLESLPYRDQLHAGELAALALLLENPDGLFLCDDTAARLAAEMLGFDVTGTLGILLRALRRGAMTRAQTVAIVRDIPTRSTLHVSHRLLSELVDQLAQSRE